MEKLYENATVFDTSFFFHFYLFLGVTLNPSHLFD